jgi:hypothetical protein
MIIDNQLLFNTCSLISATKYQVIARLLILSEITHWVHPTPPLAPAMSGFYIFNRNGILKEVQCLAQGFENRLRFNKTR